MGLSANPTDEGVTLVRRTPSDRNALGVVYDVMLNDEKVGQTWKVLGRSFSGAWRGADRCGRTVSMKHTRREVVEWVLDNWWRS